MGWRCLKLCSVFSEDVVNYISSSTLQYIHICVRVSVCVFIYGMHYGE